MISHRFATAADIDKYYGERPAATIRAIVILIDDEPAGIAGLVLKRGGDRCLAFSEFKPELEPHLKTMPVLRAVKSAQRMILETPLPVLVYDTTNPPLLERLGFTEIEPGVHLCLH